MADLLDLATSPMAVWVNFWHELPASRWRWRAALSVSNLVDDAAAGVLVAAYHDRTWGAEWLVAIQGENVPLPDEFCSKIETDLPPPTDSRFFPRSARARARRKWQDYWRDFTMAMNSDVDNVHLAIATSALFALKLAASPRTVNWARDWAPSLETTLVRGYAARLLDDLPSPPRRA